MMIIRYFKFRSSLRKLIKENNELLALLAKSELDEIRYEHFNLSWIDDYDGLWRGWIYNEKNNRYLFDDLGSKDLVEYWNYQEEWEKSLEK